MICEAQHAVSTKHFARQHGMTASSLAKTMLLVEMNSPVKWWVEDVQKPDWIKRLDKEAKAFLFGGGKGFLGCVDSKRHPSVPNTKANISWSRTQACRKMGKYLTTFLENIPMSR